MRAKSPGKTARKKLPDASKNKRPFLVNCGMRPPDELVEICCQLAPRKISLGRSQVGAGNAVQPTQFFNLLRSQPKSVLLCQVKQSRQGLPGLVPGTVELVGIHALDYTPPEPQQMRAGATPLMSDQEDLLQIATPENVAFSFPIAGIGSRFIAALIDTGIIVSLQIIVAVFGLIVTGVWLSIEENFSRTETLSAWIVGLSGLVSFAFLWGYYIFFDLIWNGQSPGKRLTKLRVIRYDGNPISLVESAIRNLIRLIDFLPLIYGLGVVVMFIDRKSRRLGDLAAGTIVIRENHSAYYPAVRQATFAPPLPDLPIERLTAEDIALIESFLKRSPSFSNHAALGDQILQHVYQRFQLPPPELESIDRDRLLQSILASYYEKI